MKSEHSIDDKIVTEAQKYVYELLDKKLSKQLVYHSTKHTKDVLSNVRIIANEYNIQGDDLNILILSALFHDVGFIDVYEGHEYKSVEYAKKFLHKKNIDEEQINKISNAILATKVPQNPKDFISEILCDADLMNLSNEDDYLDDAELLRTEWKNSGLGQYTKSEFFKISLEFFNNHHYHTNYGKTVLKNRKDKTEKILLKKR